MTQYRSCLPQLQGGLFLTDGGIETTLIFHEGLELPHFAAFDLLKDEAGRTALRHYYARYIEIARRDGTGFVLESPTWRASPDWGRKLGYSDEQLDQANRDAVALMQELRRQFEIRRTPMVVSGCVGPRGDGYDPGQVMSPEEAAGYHGRQIRTFGQAGVDMVTAITMTNANEAIGVTRAAQEAGLPVAVSFTLETDGRLPTGQGLKEAVEEVDAATSGGPAYYMINCAHPTHFEETLSAGGAWTERVRGLRANASRRSHQELNDAPDLDDGDPVELGRQYGDLLRRHPQINVLGGCCGTDHRHVEQIGAACRAFA
ncbi:homocysteine S-methyltransferase family protein [Inquilinus sp. Marseille-Q2685]|uniref:homocysteine S-methyltransferase family protein n=1 Tax=Inquilinus sp. Marseille-Q2685 TaxID=2866581 RepID=UPI001CE45C4E|nr:homocysteine S-methyltransferase family protein [Inquilinus sp. Marseille-Q2685]